MDSLINQWLKGNTSLIYCGDLVLTKNDKVKVYNKPLTFSTEHKIKDNLNAGYKTAYCIESIEDFCQTYLRSLSREESNNNNPRPKKIGPSDIYNLCKKFTYIKDNMDLTDYMAEVLTVYSSPDLFINDLLERAESGEFNYANITSVPKKQPIFRIFGKTYIHVQGVLDSWKTLFNYKCIYSDVEVKRAIWAVSKTCNLYTFNLEQYRYRMVK